MAESRVRFTLPEIHDNPNGWGPSSTTDKFSDIPYQPFSKGDRLGKVNLCVKRSPHKCKLYLVLGGGLGRQPLFGQKDLK